MMLLLEGVDPTIPEYVANGPYEPFTIIATIPATATTHAVPERYAIKEIRQWSDEDKKKVGLDAKAKTIISMALPDEAFHSIIHLKTSKEMWTLWVRLLKNFKRKGKGLIAEEHDWVESEESSSDEEEVDNLCLMAEIKEEVEEPIGTSMSYISSQVSIYTSPSLSEAERSRAVVVLTIDLYNSLNGKTLAENKNIDLTEQLEKCHERIKELTLLEETEKATVDGWCKSSTKITEIIRAQIPGNDKTGLGYHPEKDESSRYCSMLKFGMFVTSIPDTSSTHCSSSSNPIPEDLSKSSKLADKGKSIYHP
ncbi:hypothetical protein L6452_02984 [Arctium lappa]|uniref:Uncharacterized protein n=1 Tax=Arctium lappa TaxID=4217 RepID=A0ACB9FLT0_ARCLA|nr:hypothetical protein L6452_02984 [Arctium lappa]